MTVAAESPAVIARRVVTRIVSRTSLTDARPSGELLQTVQALAEELATRQRNYARLRDARNPARSRGRDLVSLGAEYGVSDVDATFATCFVKFTRPTSSGTVAIPAGTPVWSQQGQGYVTTTSVSILDGETESASVLVRATVGGSSGNAAAGAITIVTGLPGSITVVNVTAAVDGLDGLTVAEFREAIRRVPASVARCNATAIEDRVRQARTDTGQRISFSRRVYSAQPSVSHIYVDDGAGTLQSAYATAEPQTLSSSAVGGEILFYTRNWPLRTKPTVYKDGVALLEGTDYTISRPQGQVRLLGGAVASAEYTVGQYTYWTGLVAEGSRLIYGDPTDLVNYPPYIADGGETLVQGARVQVPQFTVVFFFEEGANPTAAQAAALTQMVAYINRLKIGQALKDSALHAVAVRVAGVDDIDLPGWADVYPDVDTVLRITPDDITVSGA